MKLKIFGEEKEEKELILTLTKKWDGQMISVAACDSSGNIGEGGFLIGFTSEGKIQRFTNVSRELGFDLDEDDKIRTTDF